MSVLDWDQYPISGRTQWFAGSYCQKPCGVGYGYVMQTFGATGIYAQFNLPIIGLTTFETDPTRLVWDSEFDLPGFLTHLALIRDVNPTTKIMEWQIEASRIDPDGSIRVELDQAVPNLRLRFTMPPAKNPSGDPIPLCPNNWTVTPMTRAQVNEYQGL